MCVCVCVCVGGGGDPDPLDARNLWVVLWSMTVAFPGHTHLFSCLFRLNKKIETINKARPSTLAVLLRACLANDYDHYDSKKCGPDEIPQHVTLYIPMLFTNVYKCPILGNTTQIGNARIYADIRRHMYTRSSTPFERCFVE